MTSESTPTTETWTEAVLLTVREQKAVLEHLQKGMSPAMACSTAGVSLESLRLTLAVDARLRRKCDPISETLTENVRAAVYSKAIKGTVTAQALWLKEEAVRKASREDDAPLTPDELLAELDQLSHLVQSLRAEEGSP